MKIKKLNIGVIMGGKSVENEVSFNSGRTICDHLDTTKYNVIPIFQTFEGKLFILPLKFLHRGKTSDFLHRLEKESEQVSWDNLKELIDFMYIATHGRYAEDGTLQGMLEILGIPYLGSKVFASAISRDKLLAYKFLKLNGIDVPNHFVIYPDESEKNILQKLENSQIKFPCIIKPHKEGSSLGIKVANNENELLQFTQEAANVHPGFVQPVIIEEKLDGKEFTCISITDKNTGKLFGLPPTEIVIEKESGLFDYEQKYMPGRATKFTPARLPQDVIKQIQETCIKVMQVLEMQNLSRIDGFYTADKRIVIIDPNTLSGMAPSSFLFRQAAEVNMSHTNLINHLIETELKNYNLENQSKNKLEMKNKTKVAVLFGGRSNEKEISLESGRNIFYKLSPEKYEALPIFVNKDLNLYKINQKLLVHNNTSEIEEHLEQSMKVNWSDLPKVCNFVFLGLHGGEGENGTIQGALEMLEIPYNGSSVFTSALCMNKFKTNTFLKDNGFKIPESVLVEKKDWQKNSNSILESIKNKINAPFIVKPHDDGCSVFVQKAKNITELENSIKEILEKKDFALVEECIIGTELTVGAFGNEEVTVLPPSQVVTAKDILSIEEKFLPGAGENQTPALLKPEQIKKVQQVIHDVYKAVGCKGYARIDCFFNKETEEVTIIEINTLPGMTPATCIFHQAAEIGMSPMQFIDKIVELGFENWNQYKTTLYKKDHIVQNI